MKHLLSFFFSVYLFHFTYAQTETVEFTESGTFTIPDGITSVTIEVVGAGGSGGYNGTGGGGGGAYAQGEFTVTPLQVLTITVGVPDLGAEAGTTEVDGYIMATGGENGVSVPNPEIGGGGLGGVAYGGTINYAGGKGGGGYYTYFGGGGGGAGGPSGNGSDGGNTIAWTGICFTPGGDGGLSGGAPGGDGGKGAGFTDDFCINTDPSAPGVNYGGGGGGGNGNGGGPSEGAGGYCRISYSVCDLNNTVTVNEETITAEQTGVDYQWIDCASGEPIIGATLQFFTATITGSYAVILTQGSCIDTSACITITVVIESVTTSSANSLQVYPNPFSSFIQIENATGNEELIITNAAGEIIWSGKYAAQCDLSFLPAGMYILKVMNEEKISVVKISK